MSKLARKLKEVAAPMRDLALEAARDGTPLSLRYHRLFRTWFVFGFPSFGSVLMIVWLMIAKPGF